MLQEICLMSMIKGKDIKKFFNCWRRNRFRSGGIAVASPLRWIIGSMVAILSWVYGPSVKQNGETSVKAVNETLHYNVFIPSWHNTGIWLVLTYNWTQINFEPRNTGKMMDSMFQVSLFCILIILRFRIYCVVKMGLEYGHADHFLVSWTNVRFLLRFLLHVFYCLSRSAEFAR